MSREVRRSGKWVTYDRFSRVTASGTVTEFTYTATQPVTFELVGVRPLKDNERSLYVLDDGTEVVPAYVAGWPKDAQDTVWAQPFPVNDGRIRPDNGREVDFSTWALAPRRAYHFKVTWSE